MAHTNSKTKKASAGRAPKPRSSDGIVKVAEEVLQKLHALNSDPQLQSELQWCIGSFKHDQNPSGLFEKMTNALPILKAEHTRKTKEITAKLIGDVQKILLA